MIEFKSVTKHDSSFSYNTEASRKKNEQDVKFNKLFNYETEETADSDAIPEIRTEGRKENDENIIYSNVEVLTYNFFGKIMNSEFISGLSIDVIA